MGGEVRRMKLWVEDEEDEAMGGGMRRMKLWVER